MNSLNSILIEGILSREPEKIKLEKDIKSCSFTIQSYRYFVEKKEKKQEICSFKIQTFSRLAEYCIERLSKGTSVRVIGRLGQKGADVFIVAEEVHTRPQLKRPEA
jgi:single-strand DNA-binding protein